MNAALKYRFSKSPWFVWRLVASLFGGGVSLLAHFLSGALTSLLVRVCRPYCCAGIPRNDSSDWRMISRPSCDERRRQLENIDSERLSFSSLMKTNALTVPPEVLRGIGIIGVLAVIAVVLDGSDERLAPTLFAS